MWEIVDRQYRQRRRTNIKLTARTRQEALENAARLTRRTALSGEIRVHSPRQKNGGKALIGATFESYAGGGKIERQFRWFYEIRRHKKKSRYPR